MVGWEGDSTDAAAKLVPRVPVRDEAEVARLERLHREQMAARAAVGPNTGANQ